MLYITVNASDKSLSAKCLVSFRKARKIAFLSLILKDLIFYKN